MQDSSTTHVSRVGAFDRAGHALVVARTLSPVGLDWRCDALVIHRNETILCASPAVCALFECEVAEDLVGFALRDFVHPRDRGRLLAAIVPRASAGSITVTLVGSGGRSTLAKITALPASDVDQPFEILYLRPSCLGGVSHGEDERYMATRESPVAGQEAQPTHVLICDDEARLGTLTAGLLAEYGFSSVTVGTGEDAIVALSKADPAIDVVLLDVNLSHGKPAREVLATIVERGDSARVVLTSGLAEEDVDPGLITHPAVAGYVAKPYGVEELVRSIKKALVPRSS